MIDIVLINAPFVLTDLPLAAAAMLGGTLKKHGFDYRYLDINAEVNLDKARNDPVIRFCEDQQDVTQADMIADHISDAATRALDLQSRWIGISLFCYQCQNYTRLLCQELKIRNPDIKIVLGGPGIITNGLNGDQNLGVELIGLGLADEYIHGDGELSLIKLLSDQSVDRKSQISDLDSLPFADYEQYDFSLYPEKKLIVVGSRGCVRKCTFCDIHSHWPRFTFRSGEHIAREIISNHELYSIRDYWFADSLVNGSMIAYRDMVSHLAIHNSTLADEEKLRWEGQFIFRPKNQFTDSDWRLTKESGVRRLFVGVESMIDHIRSHMGKKFSNDDIFHSLDRCLDLDIRIKFLMIVGYVTETEQDHQEEMMLYEKLAKYQSILRFQLGGTLAILPGTPLHAMSGDLGVTLGKKEDRWHNENGNYQDRLRRRNEKERALTDLGLWDPKEWQIKI